MSDHTENHSHGWPLLLWALLAGIVGLAVYAHMRPETEIGRHVKGLCDSLAAAMRKHCPMCRSAEAESGREA